MTTAKKRLSDCVVGILMSYDENENVVMLFVIDNVLSARAIASKTIAKLRGGGMSAKVTHHMTSRWTGNFHFELTVQDEQCPYEVWDALNPPASNRGVT